LVSVPSRPPFHNNFTKRWTPLFSAYLNAGEAIIAQLKAQIQSEILTDESRQKLLTSLNRQAMSVMAHFEQVRPRA
jgi:hypothetical protein